MPKLLVTINYREMFEKYLTVKEVSMIYEPTKIVPEKKVSPPSFRVGETAKHISGRVVLITGGENWGAHGFAGSWCWREVLPDGSLGREEQGFRWQVA